MPRGLPPADVQAFLRGPNPAMMASVRADGLLHSVPTWYEWCDDGTVLLNLDRSRSRFSHLEQDGRVALTVLDPRSWYRHVSISGRVVELRPDRELADIDRLARSYTGEPYPDPARDSWTAIVRVERWHGWVSDAGRPGQPLGGNA